MSLFERGVADEDDLEQYDRSLFKEAHRVVNDIKFGVELAELSNVLESNELIAYINLRTFEKNEYCVEITASGYRIVADRFDAIDERFKEEHENLGFESYEPLMHQISPLFVKKFNDLVAERLNSIK